MPPDLTRIPLPTAGQARRKKPTPSAPTGKKNLFQPGNDGHGGGRKKGGVSAVQLERLVRMDSAAAEVLRQMSAAELNEMPAVAVLETAMRIYLRIGDIDKAAKLAAELAPYTAPRLAATAHVTEDGLRALGKRDLERLIAFAGSIPDAIEGYAEEGTGSAEPGEQAGGLPAVSETA
jgi:hypothetical protein